MVFGVANNSTHIQIILNAQTYRLTLKPTVNFMAPKKVCRIMHALSKGTLDETFINRQIVDAIMVSQNLLPPMETQRKTA